MKTKTFVELLTMERMAYNISFAKSMKLHPMAENYLKFERDAKRYQWLRERHENTIMDIYNSISPAMISPELFDAAIDSAMEKNT